MYSDISTEEETEWLHRAFGVRVTWPWLYAWRLTEEVAVNSHHSFCRSER